MRWLAGLALAIALAASACGGDEEPASTQSAATETGTAPARKFPGDSAMANLQERGEITIGVKFDVPPFGFKNTESGDVAGFDVELGKAVAEALGVEPKFVEATSGNRIPLLQEGKADVVFSTMTITAERDRLIDFSQPYYVAHGRILVKEDNEAIRGRGDLAGKTVCTALGSTYEQYLRENVKAARLTLVENYSQCLTALQEGVAEAVVTDDVILTGMIIRDPGLKLVGSDLTTEPYGAGVKEGVQDLQLFVSGVVERTKVDGRWQDAYNRWVKPYTKQTRQPPGMTLREALESDS